MQKTSGKRMEVKDAIDKMKAAGYSIVEKSTYLDCKKGEIRYPIDITNETVAAYKVNYMVYIS